MVGTNDWAGQGENYDDVGSNESRGILNITYENWKLSGKDDTGPNESSSFSHAIEARSDIPPLQNTYPHQFPLT